MPKPTNYVYWEATYGVRVAVHDREMDGTRITRVSVWTVPDAVRQAAKPYWKAIQRKDRAEMDLYAIPYKQAIFGLKPPPAGATVIGYLVEQGNGIWSWTRDQESYTNARTIQKALDELVSAWKGEQTE